MLPSAFDPELFKRGGFGFGKFVLDDGIHAAAAGACVQRGAQVSESIGVSGGSQRPARDRG